jgi:hypothetical protein
VQEERECGIPAGILLRYKQVTLCADIMYIIKIPFLVTVMKHIHFGTVEAMSDKKIPTIKKAVKAVVQLVYKQRGFVVEWAMTDTNLREYVET